MIYIEIETRFESPQVFGPYTEISKGGWGDFEGTKPDGTIDNLFEITTGSGGYCDTCDYNYVSFEPGKVMKGNKELFETEWEAVHIRIFYKED